MRRVFLWASVCVWWVALFTVGQHLTAKTREGSPTSIGANGHWLSTKSSILEQTSCSLSLEAGLVFKSGDVKPVARTEFYLSKKSFVDVLREFDKMHGEEPTKDEDDRMVLVMFGAGVDFLSRNALNEKGIAELNEKVATFKKNVLASTITDFSGKAIFESIASGVYYLVGWTKMGKNAVVWNVKVMLKPGPNKIVLDQNNGNVWESI